MVANTGGTLGFNTLRFLNQPISIEVIMDLYSGEPRQIIKHGQIRFVRIIFETWIVSTYWWRKKPLQRIYFSVITSDEAILTVYKDSLTGGWYAQNA